jgi:hypothetical protein
MPMVKKFLIGSQANCWSTTLVIQVDAVTAHIIHQKILNRALNLIEQSPEEEQERELDRPERGPEHHVDSELELQKQGCPAHESGSDWLKLGANIRKFIHGGYGNLVEDGSDDVAKHGEKDLIVIDE